MSGRRQYPFHLIEPKWQQHWDEQQTFRAWNPGETLPPGHPFAQRHGFEGKTVTADQLPPKYYILDMFPYPSGAGLHVGHPEGYTATDILARYQRARGRHVLHPMGWDAFGLPAEQYAIKTGQHPRKTTETNITTFKRQIKSLGFSYDWSREVDTTDPNYFKWSQWIFLKLYNSYFDPELNKAQPIELLEDALSENPKRKNEWKNNAFLTGTHEGFLSLKEDARPAARQAFITGKRLAYVSEAPVNWCPELGTVLANEEVIDGKSEVGGFPVVRRPMRQWMLRITAYAERLLADLDTIDWTDSLKEMQRNWIGKSEGAEVDFQIADDSGTGVSPVRSKEDQSGSDSHGRNARATIRVFTTRPDTLFGATYMVLAPEHRLVDEITTEDQLQAVQNYREHTARKSDLERTELAKEKTGVFTGAYAINPANGEKIPIWIADYVLATYGTGAIMAVPAHDERDFEFAEKFKLPIVQVVQPPDAKTNWQGFVDDGTAVNSGFLDGLSTQEAKKKITAWLESKSLGKKTINYKLRDWLFSRQRYWGEPFPIIWKRDAAGNLHHEALPESALPVLPPKLDDYKPTSEGQPPLARAQDWVNLPDGSIRETNTMPQWAGSCWYYLRYLDSKNLNLFVNGETENYWMGGDTVRRVTKRLQGDQPPSPGVDLYVGGAEHAVLHLLYARFWHKVLFDLGHVSTAEPFFKLVNQGIILGETEYFAFLLSPSVQGNWISSDDVVDIEEIGHHLKGRYKKTGEEVTASKLEGGAEAVEKSGSAFVLKGRPDIKVEARSSKMSKSRDNVVNPDDVLKYYGADAFRLYEMFMGPLQDSKPWNTKGVEGVYRFLGRVWRLFVDEQSETEFEQAQTTATDPQKSRDLLNLLKLNASIKDAPASPAQLKILHATIKKVTEDLDGMRFNTAISEMMVFVNDAIKWETKPAAVLREFLILLAPFAPHVAEELWAKLSSTFDPRPSSLSYAEWPKFDPALLIEETLEIPVQVSGKLRDVIKVDANADNATLEAAAKASEKVQAFLAGKTIKKVIIVPKKLINIVAV